MKPSMKKPNLRLMKREATVKALADAAFELALEAGFDGFVVEDVVSRAGYSRRTFANHFSCKEEAVVAGASISDDTIEIENWLANLNEETPMLDVLFQLIHMQMTMAFLRKLSQLMQLCAQHPSLHPFFLNKMHHIQIDAHNTLMAISDGKHDEAYIHLLVGAVYGAILPVLNGSVQVLLPDEASSDTSFQQYLDKIYEYLRNGFNH